jgi:nitrite reductase/ring-hydroxylating ferredoxin subunit
MTEVFVADSAALREGERKILTHGKHEIGVVRANGQLQAYRNVCPHQGGPVCEGAMIHRVEEIIADDKTYLGMKFSETDINIVCPWHGWEFDVATGRCAGDGRHSLKKYPVSERDGGIYVIVT